LFCRKKIGRVSESRLAEVDALFSSTATATHAAIVLGPGSTNPVGRIQFFALLFADGKLEANYDKHHLLPGVEPEKPGNTRVTVDQPSGRWGLQIARTWIFPN